MLAGPRQGQQGQGFRRLSGGHGQSPHPPFQSGDALLQDTGVAILPGSDFGRSAEELTARVAFVDFDGAQALQALADGETLDEAFLRRHAPRVVDGIEAMARWAQG